MACFRLSIYMYVPIEESVTGLQKLFSLALNPLFFKTNVVCGRSQKDKVELFRCLFIWQEL